MAVCGGIPSLFSNTGGCSISRTTSNDTFACLAANSTLAAKIYQHMRRKEYFINAWKATPKGLESVSRSKKKYSATGNGAEVKKRAHSEYVKSESGDDAKKHAQSQ